MGVHAQPRKLALARLAYIRSVGPCSRATDTALVEMLTAGSGCGKGLWLSREARMLLRKWSSLCRTIGVDFATSGLCLVLGVTSEVPGRQCGC